MSLSADYSEDDLINFTFEVCNTKQTGEIPASVFIKYLEDVTGYNHENNKLLLLYNMLDPGRQNVLVDRITFHAVMKKWITICYQDGISESEPDKLRRRTNKKIQYCIDMISSISDEGAEIFEGRAEDSEMVCDLSNTVEDLKYMNQKMAERLVKMQKVVEESEETCLQLRDDISELQDKLARVQKLQGSFKYIYKELEGTKNEVADLNDENRVICEGIASLKKNVEFLTTKLNSIEENFLNEIKSQNESMFKALMEEMELRQKMGHSLADVTQALANLFPFIETWNKVLEKLETFLRFPQLLAKPAWFNLEIEESSESNVHSKQNTPKAEIKTSSDYMQWLINQQDSERGNGSRTLFLGKADDEYSVQEEFMLEIRNRNPHKADAACSKSTSVLPAYSPPLASSATWLPDNDDVKLQTSLIDALNLEQSSTQKRCCWTFPNLFFWGQRPGTKENLLNKKRHVCKTDHGQNNKRNFEVNSQANTEDEIKHFYLPRYSAVIQRAWDHKTPQGLSSEVNLKQTFPSVHGLFSPHCNPKCTSPLIMPTHPEDVGQPAETQHSVLSSRVKESAEAAPCNMPSIIFPECTVTPDPERDKNLAFRPVSPHLRRSSRHSRASATSLTSVDDAGHVIDLVNDDLPEVTITDEDKKKNLELLEEAKRVSEKFLTRRGRKSRSSLSESPTALSPSLSPSVSPAPSRSNSFTLPSPPGSDMCASTAASVSPLQNTTKGLTEQKGNDQRKTSQGILIPHPTNLESPNGKLSEQRENFDPHKPLDNLSKTSSSSTDTGKVSVNSSTSGFKKEHGKVFPTKRKEKDSPFKCSSQELGTVSMDPKLKGSAPLLKDSNVSCKTQISTFGVCPPLSRGVLWDRAEHDNIEKTPFKPPREEDKNFATSNMSSNLPDKPSAFKDLQIQVQPVRMQKLSKLREEHILMRNQNLVGLKLPDLSEAAEQERGSSPVPFLSEEEEESKNRCDVMPNIPDTLLRKLRVHTSLPGSSPPLTEREVENVFIQLSLAFRNDSYTMESRISQAERERNLAEENTEKELDNFKAAITSSASLWHHSEHKEMYQRLLEDIAVLLRLASRLSSRAEMVGAVRQEKRMSKATEVMMQYVENLKRTYEKDHAELMEYKKLASQNSSRSYGSPEDGVPRTSRSMSLSVGKMPRRRVSVAVVSKFELPGQSAVTSPSSIPLMSSSQSESSNGRSNQTVAPVLPALVENGKSNGDADSEPPSSGQTQIGLEDINPEAKAKIEEEAYNKGYQEGLKKTKELEKLKEDDEEKIEEASNECVAGENDNEISKECSKLEVIVHYVQILYPKLHKHWNVLWIVAAMIIIFAVVLGISTLYNYFFSCTELSNGPKVKATCSAVQHSSWWNTGLQHGRRTE